MLVASGNFPSSSKVSLSLLSLLLLLLLVLLQCLVYSLSVATSLSFPFSASALLFDFLPVCSCSFRESIVAVSVGADELFERRSEETNVLRAAELVQEEEDGKVEETQREEGYEAEPTLAQPYHTGRRVVFPLLWPSAGPLVPSTLDISLPSLLHESRPEAPDPSFSQPDTAPNSARLVRKRKERERQVKDDVLLW